MSIRTALLVATIFSMLLGFSVKAETTLETIKSSGVIKLGYRENSPPFSFAAEDGSPQGYTIDLCRYVATDIARQLSLKTLDTQWLPVNANSRFSSLQSGDVDIVCGNTSQTLTRRSEFDFSVTTFTDGAGLLYLPGMQPKSTQDLSNQRFVVVSGTTTEAILDEMIKASRLNARLLKVEDHDAALNALKQKNATAYAADRTVLIATALKDGSGHAFELSSQQFSYEPYALMMRRDPDFRLAVDRALSRLYKSGEIVRILGRWFSDFGGLNETTLQTFQLFALPE